MTKANVLSAVNVYIFINCTEGRGLLNSTAGYWVEPESDQSGPINHTGFVWKNL